MADVATLPSGVALMAAVATLPSRVALMADVLSDALNLADLTDEYLAQLALTIQQEEVRQAHMEWYTLCPGMGIGSVLRVQLQGHAAEDLQAVDARGAKASVSPHAQRCLPVRYPSAMCLGAAGRLKSSSDLARSRKMTSLWGSAIQLAESQTNPVIGN
ncbi:hypothetical protein CYMTET_18655 [Cymbomonas tetramitiformis]|uniref:Uncharacterized protein n=1 Tax=Cymbomonas tetramitiformis TaxID=36881 RepID=A0AAE0G881_9CHLO|nr:hypothetical protein CYMTET_18655 [Cymbomonas tetramitiformis]